MPPRIFSLIKEYCSIHNRLLSYDILEASTSQSKLQADAKRLQYECLRYRDPFFDNVEESDETYKEDHLTCWQAGNGFYCGYMKDPSTNICYRVSDKSVIVI